jgi:hypothetical protein
MNINKQNMNINKQNMNINTQNMNINKQNMNIRGGPLDILGGGVADARSWTRKKIPASTRGKKKNSCNFIRNPSESSHCVIVYHC